MKTKTKKKMKTKMKTKSKPKMKTKTKNKMERKTKMKVKMNFRFCFHFGFDFCFCFCFLKVFAFLLILRGLEVPQMVNCLLIDLKVPQHFFQLHVAQRCHRRSTLSYLAQICHSILFCEFSTWPSGAIDGQLSLHGLEVQQHLEIWHLA